MLQIIKSISDGEFDARDSCRHRELSLLQQAKVRTEAIQVVLANYHLLQEALELIQQGTDEYAMKAVGYLNSMEKFSTYFGLKLSHLVFSATEQLSLTLQGRDTTIQEAVQASKLAVHFIE